MGLEVRVLFSDAIVRHLVIAGVTSIDITLSHGESANGLLDLSCYHLGTLPESWGCVIRGYSLAKVKVHAFYTVFSNTVGEE